MVVVIDAEQPLAHFVYRDSLNSLPKQAITCIRLATRGLPKPASQARQPDSSRLGEGQLCG